MAEPVEDHVKDQVDIAELQSQIAELRRNSTLTTSEIERVSAERASLMEEISSAAQARKVALALRVKNIDTKIAGLNRALVLIEKQIAENEATILQLKNIGVVNSGDVGNVIDRTRFQEKQRKAINKKNDSELQNQVSGDLDIELAGDLSSDDADIANILAEAEGVSPSVPEAQPAHPEQQNRGPLPQSTYSTQP